VNFFKRLVERIDRFQQRHRALAFPFAVVKKFGDDQAGNLAALIAYYGFFSLFPLLLVFITVLGFVLNGHPALLASVQRSALRQFPVIGTDIKVGTLTGDGVALAVGVVTTLWAGMGVTQAAQNAMNEIWDIPKKDRPNFLISRLRGLLMLAVLGSIMVASIFLAGLGTTSGQLGFALRILGLAGSLALNLTLYLLAYRILTRKDLTWGQVFPGAAVAAVLWTMLQAIGGFYVTHQVKNARSTYGTFAVVIGLLVWIYLGAQLTLLCAEINVVKVRRLWPRSLIQPPLLEADERTLTDAARVEERRPEEKIGVSFGQEGQRPVGNEGRS
jgi:YihY family inner membrane protein